MKSDSLLVEICKNKLFLITTVFLLFTLFFSIHTNGIYLIVAFSFFLFLIPNKSKYLTRTSIYIICFSLLYSMMLQFNGFVNSWYQLISYLISPFCFYVLGNWLIDNIKVTYNLHCILLLILFCFSTYLYVYTIYGIVDIGLVNPLRKIALPFSDDGYNATYYGLHTCLGFVGIFFFLSKKKKDLLAILYLIMFFLSFIVIIHVVNRSGIVVSLVLFLLYYFYKTKRGTEIIYNVIKATIFMICLYLLLSEFISVDILDAYSAREDEDTGTERIERWIYAMKQLFIQPLGFKLQGFEGTHIHNFLLDIARLAGLFPFIFMFLATIRSLKSSYKIYKMDSDNVYMLVVMLNIAFLLSAILEPVLEAIPILFYIACMVWGIQDRILYTKFFKPGSHRVVQI